ncbi:MAG: hypothetical protein AVDCRST_MAG56-685 [uncultured Cytophagales bacterium]|uniref:Uncharacterized protein n=1 Tax=uncultured Cytophagales bacterium TaxID=158755 RepID=A0A6J4HCC4_9SPHI|nr:MAG: hypothetical protein AVDCRST_MAG56-685 [uncultured Cytophagales bacterium]
MANETRYRGKAPAAGALHPHRPGTHVQGNGWVMKKYRMALKRDKK